MSNYMDYLAKRVGYPTYNAYLRSEHWVIFSNGMRRSKCFCCGYSNKLHIHHITYENLGKELPTDVITVCERCHNAIHELVKDGKPLTNAHYIHLKNINKSKKPIVKKKKKSWVDWKELCNPYIKETPNDVLNYLVDNGYMYLDRQYPTGKAIVRKLANKKNKWHIPRYRSIRRDDRRAEKRGVDIRELENVRTNQLQVNKAYLLNAEMDHRLSLPNT